MTIGERHTNNQAGKVNKEQGFICLGPKRQQNIHDDREGSALCRDDYREGVTVRTVMERLKDACIKRYGRAGDVVESRWPPQNCAGATENRERQV